MTSAAAPCVLLVEDDTSITRFVAMALDQLPIELLTCTSVPAAVALVTIPRQSRGHSGCEPLKAAVRGR